MSALGGSEPAVAGIFRTAPWSLCIPGGWGGSLVLLAWDFGLYCWGWGAGDWGEVLAGFYERVRPCGRPLPLPCPLSPAHPPPHLLKCPHFAGQHYYSATPHSCRLGLGLYASQGSGGPEPEPPSAWASLQRLLLKQMRDGARRPIELSNALLEIQTNRPWIIYAAAGLLVLGFVVITVLGI